MNLESKEDKLLLAQLADKQRQCEQRQYPVCSDFLDPRQQALAQAAFAKRVACCFWGGYAEAERRLLVFLPDYISQEEAAQDSSLIWPTAEDEPLLVLRARPTARQSKLSHRDYLGALLSLGISRNKMGDLLVRDEPEESADIIILRELADYLLLNFERAGRCSLTTELLPASVLQHNKPKVELLKLNVSSLRLDAVAAAAFGVSRSKAAAAIAARLVAVDGLPQEKPDCTLTEGRHISWQGKGKARLADGGGKTRKERLWLAIEKYI